MNRLTVPDVALGLLLEPVQERLVFLRQFGLLCLFFFGVLVLVTELQTRLGDILEGQLPVQILESQINRRHIYALTSTS